MDSEVPESDEGAAHQYRLEQATRALESLQFIDEDGVRHRAFVFDEDRSGYVSSAASRAIQARGIKPKYVWGSSEGS